MAVIGNRIRQVLRILHTEGQCTAREVFERMGDVKAREEANKYLLRAESRGFVLRHAGRPDGFTITQAGREAIQTPTRLRPLPVLLRPRGPCSVFDLARTL